MPRIVSLTHSLAIWVFANDHAPPHFHIIAPDTDMMIDLRTLRPIRGTCKKRHLSEALAWATVPENLERLDAAWKRLNEHD